jgi:drug/metabolite transporter (DMT)-like permease
MSAPDEASARKLPPALVGGLWMMAAALSFTVMTTLIRYLGAQIHPFEIAFVRAVVNLLLMLPFVMRAGPATVFRAEGQRLYMLRSFIGLIFLMSYFSGAAMIPVASSQALIFTSPLFASVLAIVLLGEVVRARRIAALLVGFAGAMVILRPGMAPFSLGAGLVLLGALANALSNTIVKHKTRTDHPDTVVFFLVLYVTPMILVPALFVWVWPSPAQLGWMIAIGVCATLFQRFLSRSFAAADATLVLTFDFARLPFAALIGFAAFGALPDLWVWAGGTVIFAASLYLARREALAARRDAASPTPPAGRTG